MLERLRTRSTLCLLAVGLWLLAYIVARLLLPHAMELDEAEQVFFSQWLRLGYGPQPPLYNWLQQGVFSLTGVSLAGIILLKALLLFGCFAFMLAAARRVSEVETHRSAVLIGLLLLPQVAYMPLQDLTHTVLLLSATSLFYLTLLKLLDEPSAGAYALLGLSCAVGFLAKYNFALLPIAAILAALPDRSYRARVFDPRMLITILVGGVLVAPHLAWVLTHLDAATEGTLDKMGALSDSRSHFSKMTNGLVSLGEAIIAFAALLAVVFALCHYRNLGRIIAASTPMTRFLGRILILLTLALIAVVVVTGAVKIRERWLDPFYLLLPLYLVAKLRAAEITDARASRAFTTVGLVVMPLSIAVLTLRVVAAPLIGDYTKVNIPFDGFAQRLREDGLQPAAVLSPNWHYAGNLKTRFEAVPSFSGADASFTLPFTASADHPLIAVWPAKDGKPSDMPTAMTDWLRQRPDLVKSAEGEVALPYAYGTADDRYTFSYALFQPPVPKP